MHRPFYFEGPRRNQNPTGHDGAFLLPPTLRIENISVRDLLGASVARADTVDASAYKEAAGDTLDLVGREAAPALPTGGRIAYHFDLFALLFRRDARLKDGLEERMPAGPEVLFRQEVIRLIIDTTLFERVHVLATGKRDLSLFGAGVLLERVETYIDKRKADLEKQDIGGRAETGDDAPGSATPLPNVDDGNDAGGARDEVVPLPSAGLTASINAALSRALGRLDDVAAAANRLAAMGWDLDPATLHALHQNPYLLSRVAETADKVHPLFGKARAALMAHRAAQIQPAGRRPGLSLGNAVAHALPQELSLFASEVPALADLFLARLGTSTLLQHPPTHAPSPSADRGDMIILVDESGSMSGKPVWYAKAFAAAIRAGAHRQDRRVVIASFAARASDMIVLGDDARPAEVIEWLARFLGGGTNYDPPLSFAMSTLERASGDRADIVLLSDGCFACSTELLRSVRRAVQTRGLRVWAIRFGGADPGALADVATHLSQACLQSDRFVITSFQENE